MKKLFLLSPVVFLSFLGFVFASSDDGIIAANILAKYGLIQDYSKEPNKYRLNDTITRAEVIGMAIKRKGIYLPQKYTCKNYFTDVKHDSVNNWICRAMELAADNGIISRSNAKGRPNDPITLIEALAIVLKSGDIKLDGEKSSEIKGIPLWQSNTLSVAISYGIVSFDYNDFGQLIGKGQIFGSEITKPARRRHVFHMMNNMNEVYQIDLGGGYAKSFYAIYSVDGKIEDVDMHTFKIVRGQFSKDKNRVYYGKYPILGLDPSTFEVLHGFYGWYIADEKNIYYVSAQHYVPAEKVIGADRSSFGPLLSPESIYGGHDYAKDKNYTYYQGKKIDPTRVEKLD